MNDIFKNAYFGKPYKTRDGKKANYLGFTDTNNSIYHICVIEGTSYKTLYFSDGDARGHQSKGNNIDDIISEWYNVDNEKLDELAKEYESKNSVDGYVYQNIQEAFKAGYRIAKSEWHNVDDEKLDELAKKYESLNSVDGYVYRNIQEAFKAGYHIAKSE